MPNAVPPSCLPLRYPYTSPFQGPHSFSLGAPRSAISPLSMQPLCWDGFNRPWHRFSHTFFPIQVFVSPPACDNTPLHTGCVLQVLREMIKPRSTYCPFLVSMATLIKCFFSHISGMPFTSSLPTLQLPSGGGDLTGRLHRPTPTANAGQEKLEGMKQHSVDGGHYLGTNSKYM